MDGEIMDRTARAIVTEIRRSPHKGRPAKTIFFGGGTPTFLPIDGLLSILEAVMQTHPPAEPCEITSEANPGTVDAAKFRAMRSAGFNRISIGAQSFRDRDLSALDRVHRADDIVRAVKSTRDAGFQNVSLDLMFALPNQSIDAWLKNLDCATTLEPEHLSLYCLTIEPNTRFYKLQRKGMLLLPGDDAQATMYDAAVERAESAGLRQYEISNFARPGFECRHNLAYWRGEEYAAYGPGAVERVGGVRWTHIKHPLRYCVAVERGDDLACEREALTPGMRRTESIMLRLRLNEGLPLNLAQPDPEGLAEAKRKGWIEQSNGAVRLTREGRHFCNQAILALL